MTLLNEFTVATPHEPAASEPFEVGRVQWLRRFADGERTALAAGFWNVTPEDAPEPFDVVGEADETVFLVEGRIRIEVDGGDTIELAPGTGASFNKGARMRWSVLEPSVEFFVYS